MLIKVVLQGSFSLMIFAWAQILMDLQPLIVLITGEGQLHGFSHTMIGASLIGLSAALTGKYLAVIGLKILGIIKKIDFAEISWPVAMMSALIGVYSHVLLDSIMHNDVQPWFPFSEASPLLHIISIDALHQGCVISGLIAAIVYFSLRYRHRKQVK